MKNVLIGVLLLLSNLLLGNPGIISSGEYCQGEVFTIYNEESPDLPYDSVAWFKRPINSPVWTFIPTPPLTLELPNQLATTTSTIYARQVYLNGQYLWQTMGTQTYNSLPYPNITIDIVNEELCLTAWKNSSPSSTFYWDLNSNETPDTTSTQFETICFQPSYPVTQVCVTMTHSVTGCTSTRCEPTNYSPPLPVELQYMRLNGSILQWGTLSELNNSHFTIHQSLDGTKWKPIHQLQGQNTTNQPTQYEWVIQDPRSSYYRITQHDLDNTTTTYQTFYYDSPHEQVEQISPNPLSNDDPYLLINPHTEIVRIYHLNGLLAHESKDSLIQADLIPSTYIVMVGNKFYQKLIVHD